MRATMCCRTVMQYEWPLGRDMLATFSNSAFMQSMNTCAAGASAAQHMLTCMCGVGEGGGGGFE